MIRVMRPGPVLSRPTTGGMSRISPRYAGSSEKKTRRLGGRVPGGAYPRGDRVWEFYGDDGVPAGAPLGVSDHAALKIAAVCEAAVVTWTKQNQQACERKTRGYPSAPTQISPSTSRQSATSFLTSPYAKLCFLFLLQETVWNIMGKARPVN
jgi:hypothetical protein